MHHIDPFYVSFIRSQARLKCRERFTVKQVLGLIAAMILLLCINSVIVVTKSICYDTWGVVKLFNVYYKNSVLTCSPTLAFSFPALRFYAAYMTTLPHKDPHAATCFWFVGGFQCVLPALRSVIRRLITDKRVRRIIEARKSSRFKQLREFYSITINILNGRNNAPCTTSFYILRCFKVKIYNYLFNFVTLK